MDKLSADAAAYAALSAQLHALVLGASAGRGLRAWVAGCGNGEDAYAAAALLHAMAAQIKPAPQVTVFATEASPEQLSAARAGRYEASPLTALPPAIRAQLFSERAGHAHVTAMLRERVLFATHRLLDDPPFSRLDLIICRELFASLEPAQRGEALERFAFALRPGGLLLIGSELPQEAGGSLFRRADRDYQLWLRTHAPAQAGPALRPVSARVQTQLSPPWAPAEPAPEPSHPALVVDERLQIVHLWAGVERFLRIVPGAPSYDLLDVIRPDLRAAVGATLSRARERGRAAESPPVPVTIEGAPQRVTVIAQAHPEIRRGGLVVQFDAAEPDGSPEGPGDADRAQHLPEVLIALQAQHDIVYEELRAANEELQIVNEELRISSEELEVRREELETLNEQLRLVNEEQLRTLAALAGANADLENLIASTEIGTLFLDRGLRLERYTEPARRVFHLLPSDLGRPFAHLTHELRYHGLQDDVAQVLVDLAPIEREALHSDGRWFLARLRPYRTAEQQVTGVVLTLLEISERKLAEETLRQSHAELERHVRERTAELVEANAARQALLRQLVTAQEEERLRIARELHDTLGQQITAVLLGLQSVRERSHGRAATLEELDRVWAIVQEMGREMHEIAVALRPTALDDVGLAGALRGYVESWSRRTAIPAALFVSGVEHKELPPEVESTLYRVAQEALTNIARHAGATQVSVVLESDGSRVVAAIEDNGRGFDVEAATAAPGQRAQLGLLGMRERAALLGGTLTIDSELGGGTTVIARIPLQRRERAGDEHDPARAGPRP